MPVYACMQDVLIVLVLIVIRKSMRMCPQVPMRKCTLSQILTTASKRSKKIYFFVHSSSKSDRYPE